MNLFFISAIALDKFFTIHWPMRYTALVTTKKTICVGIVINVHGLIICGIPLAGYNRFKANKECHFILISQNAFLNYLSGTILACVIFTFFLYLIIGRTALHQMRIIGQTNDIPLQSGNADVSQHTITNNLKVNLKAVKNLSLVVGVLAVSCIPFALYIILLDREMQSQVDNPSFLETMKPVSLFMLLINSTVNPAIYALKFPQFSKSFKILLNMNLSV